MKTNNNNKKSNNVINNVRNTQEACKQLRYGAQTLNACCLAVTKSLQGDKADEQKSILGVTVGSEKNTATVQAIFEAYGVQLTSKSKIDYKLCKEVLFTANLIDSKFAVYKNRPVRDEAGLRVYVPGKDGELEPLSVYEIQEVGRYEWTPAMFAKVLGQNWLPLREQKRAAKSAEDVQKYANYYVKMDGAFVEIQKSEVEF